MQSAFYYISCSCLVLVFFQVSDHAGANQGLCKLQVEKQNELSQQVC